MAVEAENRGAVRVIQRTYHDIDELETDLRISRDLRLFQLETRPLQCQLLVAAFPQVHCSFSQSNCPIRLLGTKSLDHIDFSFVLKLGHTPLLTHAMEASQSNLFGFDSNRPTRLVVSGGCQFATVQFKRSQFYDCLQVMDRDDIDDRWLAQNIVYGSETLPVVQGYLMELFYQLTNPNQCLTLPGLETLLLGDLLPLIIETLRPSSPHQQRVSPVVSRSHIFHQAEDYMLQNLEQPMTLKDLCEYLHFSSRTLFYSFQDHVGMGPMAYLKLLRLHAVRQALRQVQSEPVVIADIAGHFGFYSAGHFARAYKTLFGELPSETLN